MDAPVRLVVWSDYLCPWCYVASARLRRLRDDLAGRVTIEWRSFLLRPQPGSARPLDEFKRYTRSWARPAAEADAPAFRAWDSDAGPPSHSLPPHLVAKAAATLGTDAFDRMHTRLLGAYFGENRDITDPATLRALWDEAGLPPGEFGRAADHGLVEAVVREHNAAVSLGLSGVPAVQLAGGDVAIPGALPYDSYRRWVERALAGAF